LKDVERVLESGGIFHFWSDVEEYFQSTLELIAETTNLNGPCPVSERLTALGRFARCTQRHRANLRRCPPPKRVRAGA